MRSILSNHKLMTFAAIVIAIAGIVQSIIYKDFIWFLRSGSIIVGIGIVLLARTYLVKKDLLLDITSSETPYNVNSPEHFKALNQSVPDYVKNDLASRAAIGLYGPCISFIGTIIWGYGDLLNILIYNA